MKYIVALDQGTTSSRAVVFDGQGNVVALESIEFEQLYPKPGWVEHDPDTLLSSQIAALRAAVEKSGVSVSDIEAVGIADQRETTLLWDRQTGKALHPAIVWQCRRTAPLVDRLKAAGYGEEIRSRTGLVPDAYFSGTKLQYLLDTLPGARARAERGELCFGTVDSWLTYHLSAEGVHVTDVTNASRTMLYNIFSRRWDEELLGMMGIPAQVLPRVVDSSGVVGMLRKDILGREIPIAALAGDQHAALYGQACFSPGMTKNTYGTGCFMLMNTGQTAVRSRNNLLTTIAWQIEGKVCYALEGSVFVAGAAVKWLRDEMGLVKTSEETSRVASSIKSNEGVYLVPAFTGLGAPHWDMYSRGTIVGLTRGTGRAHIVRAALESIAYQTKDVLNAMELDSGITPSAMRVDGGASANDFLMQFQSDILAMEVVRPFVTETTALGAAMLAGRGCGLWSDRQLGEIWRQRVRFSPTMREDMRRGLYEDWLRAVERAKGWARE